MGGCDGYDHRCFFGGAHVVFLPSSKVTSIRVDHECANITVFDNACTDEEEGAGGDDDDEHRGGDDYGLVVFDPVWGKPDYPPGHKSTAPEVRSI